MNEWGRIARGALAWLAFRPAGAALAASVAALLATCAARADEPSAADKETSRALYAEGMKALDVSEFTQAERACGGAYKLVPAPTGALCWGRALEGLGKLVEARDAYLAAAHYPASPNEPEVFTSARSDARKAADAIEPRVPTLVLVISGPPQDALVHGSLDGHVMKPGTIRLPLKTNPGPHRLVIGADGFADQQVDLTLAEGERKQVSVVLGPSAAVAGTPSPIPRANRTRAYVALGVGGAGLLVGGVAGFLALSNASTAKSFCNGGTTCSPGAQPSIDSTKRWATASDVGFIVGAVGAGLGAGLLLLSSKPSDARQEGSVSLVVGPGSITLEGTTP